MPRVAALVPGYTTVARAGEVLHLAPRTVRDLIYAGRLPSVRIGRLHYVKASDLDLERRRRLGLPLPRPPALHAVRAQRPRSARPAGAPGVRTHVDSAERRRRAAERALVVSRWAARHHVDVGAGVPFSVGNVSAPVGCDACGRQVRRGQMVHAQASDSRLCMTCGRRALLDWADRRRAEAASARRLAHELGSSAAPVVQVA